MAAKRYKLIDAPWLQIVSVLLSCTAAIFYPDP